MKHSASTSGGIHMNRVETHAASIPITITVLANFCFMRISFFAFGRRKDFLRI
jgi:hypothetical protein